LDTLNDDKVICILSNKSRVSQVVYIFDYKGFAVRTYDVGDAFVFNSHHREYVEKLCCTVCDAIDGLILYLYLCDTVCDC